MRNLDYQFVKTMNINQIPEEAWQTIEGEPVKRSDLDKYYQSVPWYFRGINILSDSVASMPFSIYQGTKEVDNSDDYNNVVGFMPHPSALLSQVEAALNIWGYAYLLKMRSVFELKRLRYLIPTSVQYKIDDKTGDISFERRVGGLVYNFTPDDIVYFWKPDPSREIGIPSSSAAMTAANACGVLLNIDEFAKAFFKGGAIKTTLLLTEGIVDSAEKERLKTVWSRIAQGIRNAWSSQIFNAKAVNPVTIGEGLESLQDNDLTESKRIDIAAAFGIPYSIMWSGSASGLGGGAVAEQDEINLIKYKVIPDCEFIEEVLNEQVFEPAGYTLSFTPENLDVMQEDENARAQSLASLITALAQPEEFLIAASILGFEMDPDIRLKIEGMVAAKEERRQAMAQVAALAQNKPAEQNNQPPQPPPQSPQGASGATRTLELEKWRTKSINRLKTGRKASCPFTSSILDPVTIASIDAQLENCENVTDVDIVFNSTFLGYP